MRRCILSHCHVSPVSGSLKLTSRYVNIKLHIIRIRKSIPWFTKNTLVKVKFTLNYTEISLHASNHLFWHWDSLQCTITSRRKCLIHATILWRAGTARGRRFVWQSWARPIPIHQRRKVASSKSPSHWDGKVVWFFLFHLTCLAILLRNNIIGLDCVRNNKRKGNKCFRDNS